MVSTVGDAEPKSNLLLLLHPLIFFDARIEFKCFLVDFHHIFFLPFVALWERETL